MSIPASKSYISGKAKPVPHQYSGVANEGNTHMYGNNQVQRSVLSIKNAAAAIKRKNSYQHNSGPDLKVNVK